MNQNVAPFQTLPMTAVGYAALLNELKHRIQLDRLRIAERIKDAMADDPNLLENTEYQAAKSEQEANESRIAELQDKLARAEVIDVSKLSGDTVKFGATVTVIDEDTKEKRVWQIVGEPEADAKKHKISIFSPLARALIGKPKKANVEVMTPSGVKAYKISRVEWR
jgi:transcription elongation factor GreA